MTTLLLLASLAGTAALGAGVIFSIARATRQPTPGTLALQLGAAYPLGALLVTAWIGVLAVAHVAWSVPVVVGPMLLLIVLGAWRARHRVTRTAVRHVVDTLVGRSARGPARWLWIALVAWLALRFGTLAGEIVARPPLPWEAWLHAAAHAHVWHSLGGPVAFVPESRWWTSTSYLAGLPDGSALTPWLDLWTVASVGRFDDTVIHAPWVMFWFSQPLLAYGAMRASGATPLASLAGAAFVATLPLANAHAALGGTAALLLATYYLAAFALLQSRVLSWSMAGLVVAMIAGMVASGSVAGAIWALTLLPFAVARLEESRQAKAIAALVMAAAAAAILFSRADVVGEAIQHPPPGLAALAQHAFLLGNWHVLVYAAIGLALLASHTWRAAALLPASGSVALGLIAVLAFCTTVSGSSLLGTTGAIGNATMPWAPVLALWTALVAHGWLERSRAARPAGVQDVAPPADALRTARPTDAAG